ncbi:hypothetical protein [Caulobacter phage KcrB]|nr:hypothetical protein RW_GP047 [Caulobacter phage RW]WCA46351.1 hypothetical protein [Caulobacter phage KcrB]WCD56286.1 hypothetical protein [Caulobacter phage RLK]WNV48078.1 hypothetical protein GB2A_gp046 [Caulobacter phage GB2A]
MIIEPQHILTQEELQAAIDLIVARADELGVSVSMPKPKSPVMVYTRDGVVPFVQWMEKVG